MTADEFEARVQKLIEEARQADCSEEMMIDVLHDLAEALRERLVSLDQHTEEPTIASDKSEPLRNPG